MEVLLELTNIIMSEEELKEYDSVCMCVYNGEFGHAFLH